MHDTSQSAGALASNEPCRARELLSPPWAWSARSQTSSEAEEMIMAKRRGPARAYRRSEQRYEAVRHMPAPLSSRAIDRATKLGCQDAVRGRKNPYKAEAGGHISAYREGYRICDAIYHSGRRLTADEKRVANSLSLESEIQFTPLGGTGRKRRRKRRR